MIFFSRMWLVNRFTLDLFAELRCRQSNSWKCEANFNTWYVAYCSALNRQRFLFQAIQSDLVTNLLTNVYMTPKTFSDFLKEELINHFITDCLTTWTTYKLDCDACFFCSFFPGYFCFNIFKQLWITKEDQKVWIRKKLNRLWIKRCGKVSYIFKNYSRFGKLLSSND